MHSARILIVTWKTIDPVEYMTVGGRKQFIIQTNQAHASRRKTTTCPSRTTFSSK
jgi:hypothetical protein